MQRIIWESSPSQWTNIWCWALCGSLSWLFLPILGIFWVYLETKSTRYVLTDEILEIETGIFHKRSTHIELYRIKDYVIDEPLLMRMVGLGNLEIITSDKTIDDLVLYAIKDAKSIKNKIRDLVEKRRDAKGVHEIDFR